MSSKTYDISIIKRYLHGELDTRSMYRFERTSQEDPFLMDALDGYYILSDQQANIEELKGRLHSRIQKSKRKIFMLWPLIGAIIAVLAFAAIGVWLFTVYLPGLKKLPKQSLPAQQPAYANPQQNGPDTQATTFTVPAAVDTIKKDTSTQAKKDTALSYKAIHNPTKGSVEAATVIADLNRLPYSTVKKAVKPQPGGNTANNVKQVNEYALKNGTITNAGATIGNGTKPSGFSVNNSLNTTSIATKNIPLNNSSNTRSPATITPSVVSPNKDNVVTRDPGLALNAPAGKGAGITAAKLSFAPGIKSIDITTVSGIVLSADNSKPLAGVALRIMGTQLGTITDANGRFTIRMAHDQVLQANFVGYYGKQVAASGNNVKVILQPIKDTKPESTNSVINTAPVDKDGDNAINVINLSPANKTAAVIGEKKNLENITENFKPVMTPAENLKSPGTLMRVGGRVVALSTNYPIPNVVMWNMTANEQYRLLNDGVFDIVVHKGDEIYVGHPGYITQKIKLKNTDNRTVVLEETTSPLYSGFVRGLSINPYDDTTHPEMGWNKFKSLQKIKSADGKTGTVKIDFMVNPDNTVADLKITQSVSAPADSQAMAIVKNKTKWVHNTNNQPEKLSVKFKVE